MIVKDGKQPEEKQTNDEQKNEERRWRLLSLELQVVAITVERRKEEMKENSNA